jgi:hypothetical protein
MTILREKRNQVRDDGHVLPIYRLDLAWWASTVGLVLVGKIHWKTPFLVELAARRVLHMRKISK